ncbi:epidermal growth factor receptor kinase substrate 8-like [Protopterus annectens]|uniref:epidermal growth factor receptor kinase substrate 8-like n=1 Tax=Protopterus annectens TaxID=7888 RepID=UPI001CFA8EE1|nr:epidermal growth factor receptor kinase substrate 8-like [Protopterus annectens]
MLRMITKSDAGIPPPPNAPAPIPPGTVTQVDVRSRVAAWSAWAAEQGDGEKPKPSYEQEESLEMMAARIDRDVQILNHILDDIECFITKLQKAAEAFSELSKRKKTKKSKKKGPGEGVLTLRSKPPSQDEYIDCFQKFKYAFNLLAKLKTHIQNPSAVDLVHFLFTPLNMVVQSTGGPELGNTVLSPLITKDAIDFLHSTVTPEEKQLWISLGDTWTKPRRRGSRDEGETDYISRGASPAWGALAQDKMEGPLQSLTFLGLEGDVVSFSFRLPQNMLKELISLVRSSAKNVKIRQAKEFFSLLNFAYRILALSMDMLHPHGSSFHVFLK